MEKLGGVNKPIAMWLLDGEDAICHQLAGFGHQGTEWAIVLGFGGRSWQLTQQSAFSSRDRQPLTWDSDGVSLVSCNIEIEKMREGTREWREESEKKKKKRNTD